MSAMAIVVSASVNSSWGSKDKRHYVDGYDEGYKIGLINGYDQGYDIGIKGIKYTGTGLINRSPASTTSQDIGYADGYTVGYNLKFISGYNAGIKIYEQKTTPTKTPTPTPTDTPTPTPTDTLTPTPTDTPTPTPTDTPTPTPTDTPTPTPTDTPTLTDSSSSSSNSHSSSSSSSSSSSIGNSFSREPATNVASKELATINVVSGNHIKYNFQQNNTCIMYIEYDAERTFLKTTTTVEELKNKSTFVKDRSSGLVYKYVNIWVGDNGGGLPTSLANGVIGFRVEKSWINNNSINEFQITLQRYNMSWEPLYTKKVGEDNNYSYFTSTAPGFSFFAITYMGEADKNVTQIEAKLQNPIESLVGTGDALNGSNNSSKAQEAKGAAKIVMALALPLFLLLVGYLVFKKRI